MQSEPVEKNNIEEGNSNNEPQEELLLGNVRFFCENKRVQGPDKCVLISNYFLIIFPTLLFLFFV